MTDINDLKFTIEPDETIEMEQFVNSDNKEKEKKIWIQVNWGFYRRREFTIHDFNVFDDCKTLEDIQKKYDKFVEIGSYPFFRLGKIGVSIVSRSTSKSKLILVNKALMKAIKIKKIKILNI